MNSLFMVSTPKPLGLINPEPDETVMQNRFAVCQLVACGLFAGGLVALSVSVVPPAKAQVKAAVQRSARNAAQAAERDAARRAVRESERAAAAKAGSRTSADIVTRRWDLYKCRKGHDCGGLPFKHWDSFGGGGFNEVKLGNNTRLYRVYADPSAKFIAKNATHSYWSRSSAKGTQAIIDGAIPVANNRNLATHQVAITLPKNSVVFEGTARARHRSFQKDGDWGTTIGGGNQVIISREELVNAGIIKATPRPKR